MGFEQIQWISRIHLTKPSVHNLSGAQQSEPQGTDPPSEVVQFAEEQGFRKALSPPYSSLLRLTQAYCCQGFR